MVERPDVSKRVEKLVKRFDGLIKYTPMLYDHPDWSDDECIKFAKAQHEKAVLRMAESTEDKEKRPGVFVHSDGKTWNDGIPYCRNIFREDKV